MLGSPRPVSLAPDRGVDAPYYSHAGVYPRSPTAAAAAVAVAVARIPIKPTQPNYMASTESSRSPPPTQTPSPPPQSTNLYGDGRSSRPSSGVRTRPSSSGHSRPSSSYSHHRRVGSNMSHTSTNIAVDIYQASANVWYRGGNKPPGSRPQSGVSGIGSRRTKSIESVPGIESIHVGQNQARTQRLMNTVPVNIIEKNARQRDEDRNWLLSQGVVGSKHGRVSSTASSTWSGSASLPQVAHSSLAEEKSDQPLEDLAYRALLLKNQVVVTGSTYFSYTPTPLRAVPAAPYSNALPLTHRPSRPPSSNKRPVSRDGSMTSRSTGSRPASGFRPSFGIAAPQLSPATTQSPHPHINYAQCLMRSTAKPPSTPLSYPLQIEPLTPFVPFSKRRGPLGYDSPSVGHGRTRRPQSQYESHSSNSQPHPELFDEKTLLGPESVDLMNALDAKAVQERMNNQHNFNDYDKRKKQFREGLTSDPSRVPHTTELQQLHEKVHALHQRNALSVELAAASWAKPPSPSNSISPKRQSPVNNVSPKRRSPAPPPAPALMSPGQLHSLNQAQQQRLDEIEVKTQQPSTEESESSKSPTRVQFTDRSLADPQLPNPTKSDHLSSQKQLQQQYELYQRLDHAAVHALRSKDPPQPTQFHDPPLSHEISRALRQVRDVTIVQSLWRGYRARKLVREHRLWLRDQELHQRLAREEEQFLARFIQKDLEAEKKKSPTRSESATKILQHVTKVKIDPTRASQYDSIVAATDQELTRKGSKASLSHSGSRTNTQIRTDSPSQVKITPPPKKSRKRTMDKSMMMGQSTLQPIAILSPSAQLRADLRASLQSEAAVIREMLMSNATKEAIVTRHHEIQNSTKRTVHNQQLLAGMTASVSSGGSIVPRGSKRPPQLLNVPDDVSVDEDEATEAELNALGLGAGLADAQTASILPDELLPPINDNDEDLEMYRSALSSNDLIPPATLSSFDTGRHGTTKSEDITNGISTHLARWMNSVGANAAQCMDLVRGASDRVGEGPLEPLPKSSEDIELDEIEAKNDQLLTAAIKEVKLSGSEEERLRLKSIADEMRLIFAAEDSIILIQGIVRGRMARKRVEQLKEYLRANPHIRAEREAKIRAKLIELALEETVDALVQDTLSSIETIVEPTPIENPLLPDQIEAATSEPTTTFRLPSLAEQEYIQLRDAFDNYPTLFTTPVPLRVAELDEIVWLCGGGVGVIDFLRHSPSTAIATIESGGFIIPRILDDRGVERAISMIQEWTAAKRQFLDLPHLQQGLSEEINARIEVAEEEPTDFYQVIGHSPPPIVEVDSNLCQLCGTFNITLSCELCQQKVCDHCDSVLHRDEIHSGHERKPCTSTHPDQPPSTDANQNPLFTNSSALRPGTAHLPFTQVICDWCDSLHDVVVYCPSCLMKLCLSQCDDEVHALNGRHQHQRQPYQPKTEDYDAAYQRSRAKSTESAAPQELEPSIAMNEPTPVTTTDLPPSEDQSFLSSLSSEEREVLDARTMIYSALITPPVRDMFPHLDGVNSNEIILIGRDFSNIVLAGGDAVNVVRLLNILAQRNIKLASFSDLPDAIWALAAEENHTTEEKSMQPVPPRPTSSHVNQPAEADRSRSNKRSSLDFSQFGFDVNTFSDDEVRYETSEIAAEWRSYHQAKASDERSQQLARERDKFMNEQAAAEQLEADQRFVRYGAVQPEGEIVLHQFNPSSEPSPISTTTPLPFSKPTPLVIDHTTYSQSLISPTFHRGSPSAHHQSTLALERKRLGLGMPPSLTFTNDPTIGVTPRFPSALVQYESDGTKLSYPIFLARPHYSPSIRDEQHPWDPNTEPISWMRKSYRPIDLIQIIRIQAMWRRRTAQREYRRKRSERR